MHIDYNFRERILPKVYKPYSANFYCYSRDIQLCLINFGFNIIGSYGVVLCIN